MYKAVDKLSNRLRLYSDRSTNDRIARFAGPIMTVLFIDLRNQISRGDGNIILWRWFFVHQHLFGLLRRRSESSEISVCSKDRVYVGISNMTIYIGSQTTVGPFYKSALLKQPRLTGRSGNLENSSSPQRETDMHVRCESLSYLVSSLIPK